MTLKTALGILAMAATLGVSQPAGAQQVRRATPEPGQRVIVLGDVCKRRTDNRVAITRRDACGRWY